MSTPIIGFGGAVTFGGTAYAVEQWSLTLSNELQEVSDTAGGGSPSAGPWVTRIAGYSSAEGTFSVFLDSATAAAQLATIKQGTSATASFAVGNGGHAYSGTFLVSSVGVSNPAKSPVKIEVSASSTGPVLFA